MAALDFDSCQTYSETDFLSEPQQPALTVEQFLDSKDFNHQTLDQMVKMVQFAATHFSDHAIDAHQMPVEQQMTLVRSFAAHCQEMIALADR